MNKKQRITKVEPRIRLVAPTAVLASGLLSTAAWSAPGDLDPTFGDVGRSIGWPGTRGTLWALQPLPDDDLLFAGCGTYYDDCISTAYTGRLDGDGTLDRLLAEALLGQAVVHDFALQPDGKVLVCFLTNAFISATDKIATERFLQGKTGFFHERYKVIAFLLHHG